MDTLRQTFGTLEAGSRVAKILNAKTRFLALKSEWKGLVSDFCSGGHRAGEKEPFGMGRKIGQNWVKLSGSA